MHVPEEDPELSVECYKCSFEQNEELDLNDMKTDDYETLFLPGEASGGDEKQLRKLGLQVTLLRTHPQPCPRSIL